MSEMGAADFKAHCLQVMENVRRTRRPVTITKRGVPVVKLVPADPPRKLVLGALAGKLTSVGDIDSSPLSDRAWKAIEQERNAQWDRWMTEPLPQRTRTTRGRRRR
jgi:prevent-host-death family protein